MCTLYRGITSIACVAMAVLGLQGAAEARSLEAIQKDGKIVVCTGVMGLKPYLSKQDGGSTYTGFEYELLSDLAKRLSISRTEYVSLDFSAQIPALKSDRCDIIFSAMMISEQRRIEGGIEFSRPYFYVQDFVVVLEGSDIKTLNDLKGKSISAAVGTAQEVQAKSLIAQGYGSEFRGFNDVKSPFMALLNGQVDAAISDPFAYETQKSMTPNIVTLKDVTIQRVVSEKWKEQQDKAPYRYGAFGVGVQKENSELLEAINKAFDEMDIDGTRKQILSKYAAWAADQELDAIVKK